MVITAMAVLSVFTSLTAISTSAATQSVTASATSSKVSVTLKYSTNTSLVVNIVSCREKHSETGSLYTKTGSNSTGNGTSVAAVITPHTGYKFINASSSYNYYRYTIAGNATVTDTLPTIN